MTPGSVFFDRLFKFKDEETGRKLFVALGSVDGVYVVAKTTSQQHGRGRVFGCQPTDRFHNFYLPPSSCGLDGETWVCLDEFYEFDAATVLRKKFGGVIDAICDLPAAIMKDLQACALGSDDLSELHERAIRASLV
ncbi:hypothetical protein MKK88_22865 [Methylobacterium sp. E-005]|uniref:hypothetical protein n=1 Tax=Methylobacterium sp. E-005 TaxID=2836549 RepID=UPI001FBAC76B|nr:hypothetical protein [Methylobacterium sp. E-005]MCJ2088801.1 hypothetical protein [Methylobacterium sp. E-005]